MTLHLITLCVGFIIAYGLLQMVESFRRRRRRRDAEAAEVKANAEDGAEDGRPEDRG